MLVFTTIFDVIYKKKLCSTSAGENYCYAYVNVSVCVKIVCSGTQVILYNPSDWVGLLVGVCLSFQMSSVVTTHSHNLVWYLIWFQSFWEYMKSSNVSKDFFSFQGVSQCEIKKKSHRKSDFKDL